MSNETTKTAVPKLRFPEFREAGEWEIKPLGKVARLITKKAGSKKYKMMSITSSSGLVSQMEKFGREIAGASYKNYYVIEKGDFAYNKSSTKSEPEGQIALLENEDAGAVPNSIFTCFRVNEQIISSYFLKYPFANNIHGEWLRNFIKVGARVNGALSVNSKDLLAIPIPVPSLPEQQKIASFLSSLDDLLTAQSAKLAALQAHKRGLMQGLFPAAGETVPKLRFPEFQAAGEWEEKPLKDACRMQAGKFVSASNIHEHKQDELFPCYGGNGLRGYTKTFTHEGKYSLIGRQGALCGNVMLATGKFHATEHAIVTTPKEKVDTNWLYYELILLNLNQHATGQAQPGLSVDNLGKIKIKIPVTEKEQQKITNCLSSLDALLTAQVQKIEALKLHKKGLMQQLFPNPTETDA